MQDLNGNDIRAFLAVAEAGQIVRAAQTLRMDPTTLSRRLQRLERTLETTLFERTRAGQTLTEAGERLLSKAEAMATAASLIEETRSPGSGLSGTLRISVSEGFGSQFLTHYLKEFAAAHPNLTLELVASSGFLNPSKREADIAVLLSRPKGGPVMCRKLSDYRLRLYASRDYLRRNSIPRNIEDLADGHTFVSYVPDLVYAPELNYLDDFLPGLAAQIRSSSINAQYRLIEEGCGIGVLPRFIGDQSQNLASVCADHFIERNFWIVTHRDTQNLSKVRAGKEWLERCALAGRTRLLGQ